MLMSGIARGSRRCWRVDRRRSLHRQGTRYPATLLGRADEGIYLLRCMSHDSSIPLIALPRSERCAWPSVGV
jgi:hypothetical protein